MAANAVELTVESAWFIAEESAAGSFPWVLAITPPYFDAAERGPFADRQRAALAGLGVIDDGRINPAVVDWVRTVCFPDRWLELRGVRLFQFEDDGRLRSVANASVAEHRPGGWILREVEFTIEPGEAVGIVGINGAAGDGSNGISPGDTVTYELTYNLGTGDFEHLKLDAFLPKPVFNVGDPDADGTLLQCVGRPYRTAKKQVNGVNAGGIGTKPHAKFLAGCWFFGVLHAHQFWSRNKKCLARTAMHNTFPVGVDQLEAYPVEL